MGKYIKKKELQKLLKRRRKREVVIFKVIMSYKGKYHTEYYMAYSDEIKKAQELGLIKYRESGYADYIDWTPADKVAREKMGGLKKVKSFERSGRYVIADTWDGRYKLREDIFDKYQNENQEYILYGKRIKIDGGL